MGAVGDDVAVAHRIISLCCGLWPMVCTVQLHLVLWPSFFYEVLGRKFYFLDKFYPTLINREHSGV